MSQSTSNLDKLSKLTQEFECSEKINEKLAESVNSGMKATFSSSASIELMNKHLNPENCEWVYF